MRGEPRHALIEQVDDRAFGRLGELAREGLAQHERSAQVRLHMEVPGRARGILHLVALEAGGVVDEEAERAERLARPWHQRPHLALVREIGAKGDGAPARCRDLGHHFGSRIGAPAVMDRDREALAREVEGERAADAPRGTRHQGRLRHALRHGTTMAGSPAPIKDALLTRA